MANEVNISTPTHQLSAYLRIPDTEGPWPGVIVLHDALGLTLDSRRQVDWLAASGYIAVAPDLYSWGAKPRCLLAIFRDMLARKGPTFDDIEATKRFLTHNAECTGKVGILGFCIGGGFALLTAVRGSFAASSVNYGMVPKDADSLLRSSCPIVGSFGALDFTLKGAAGRLEHALQLNGIEHDVKEYPDAGHCFINTHSGAVGWIMARVKMNYHEQSASDARARILTFFATHLR